MSLPVSDSVRYKLPIEKTYICPKGHKIDAMNPPMVIVSGYPETKRLICNICYVEWMGENFPTNEVTE